jgi:hypothetical protein
LYYLSFCLFLLAIELSVLLSFSSGHCIICPTEGQIIQWPEETDRRTDNTMARRKRQGQIIQWPEEKDRTDNTMARRTDNTMARRKRQKDR